MKDRDWPEDTSLLNGDRRNICERCAASYVGHPNRKVCRVCHELCIRIGATALFEQLGGSPDEQ